MSDTVKFQRSGTALIRVEGATDVEEIAVSDVVDVFWETQLDVLRVACRSGSHIVPLGRVVSVWSTIGVEIG